MDAFSDEQLVDLYRETGACRPVDLLVRRHIGKVRAMIYPMVLNDMDADEITQDVFIRAIKALAGFKNRARFSTWLYRIAMNTTRSFLMKRKRSRIESVGEPPEQMDRSPNPSQAMMAGERVGTIEAALASLTPSLRAAITLTAIHGMTVQEAAHAEGCLMATMYWRLHEARRILKPKLQVS